MGRQKRSWLKGIGIIGVIFTFGILMVVPLECLAVKPNSIVVAMIGDFTGPYAPMIGPAAPGAEDACQYINEELGGIKGVKIKLVFRDNAGKASLGLQQYVELIEMKPKPLLLCVPHTPTAEALREKVLADDMIGIFPSTIEDLFPVGNTFGYLPLYATQDGLVLKYLKDNWKEKRNLRVAIITWDNSFGRSILVPEFSEYAKKIGVDIVATELFSGKDIDVTTQMARIREKNPDWLLTKTIAGGPVAIMKAVRELGMKVKLACSGLDWGTVRIDPTLFEDCISAIPSASFDDLNHPGIKSILTYMKKNNRSIKEQTYYYIVGWEYILMVHKVISDAVDKVGWDKLNTATIKNELFNLTNWEPMNGVVKVSYTKNRPVPFWTVIYKIKDGKLVPPGGVGGHGKFAEGPDMTPGRFR
ncbi:MAG: ABC transporter substrate-binding protein [Thermodesulfobacteriota bacterium]|jgi:ABC-type branched-subunit amino acid transport system substrate-binding protein